MSSLNEAVPFLSRINPVAIFNRRLQIQQRLPELLTQISKNNQEVDSGLKAFKDALTRTLKDFPEADLSEPTRQALDNAEFRRWKLNKDLNVEAAHLQKMKEQDVKTLFSEGLIAVGAGRYAYKKYKAQGPAAIQPEKTAAFDVNDVKNLVARAGKNLYKYLNPVELAKRINTSRAEIPAAYQEANQIKKEIEDAADRAVSLAKLYSPDSLAKKRNFEKIKKLQAELLEQRFAPSLMRAEELKNKMLADLGIAAGEGLALGGVGYGIHQLTSSKDKNQHGR